MFVSTGHRIDARFLNWPCRSENRSFPAAALKETVKQARRSSFYKDRIREPLHWDYAAWKQLPLTVKNDLRQEYPMGFLAQPMHSVASYHESSGTTGQPTATMFTENDWDDVVTRFMRSAVKLTAHDVVFIKTPYSLVTTAHQMERAARLVGAAVIPADNRSRNMPYAKVVRLLSKLPVSVAWCLPTEALLWAAAAKVAGLDPKHDFPHLRAFFVAGEPLSQAKRERISSLWGGVHVIQDYGSTETGSLAGECSAGKLHFWADRVFPEVLSQETGTPMLAGEGTLVVTPLYREAMPLLRYHTEDLVRLSHSPCPCGWNLPTIQILGRLSTERMRMEAASSLTNPVDISPLMLEDAVYSLPEIFDVQFWRARPTGTGFKIEISAAPEHADTACDELACALYTRLRIKADVDAVPLATFIPADVLTDEPGFQKPRFVYGADEDWSNSLVYA